MNHELWAELSARAKVLLYEKAAVDLNLPAILDETSKFVLRELAFSSYDPHCQQCDEQQSSLMTVELGHYDTDENHNYIIPADLPDKRVIEALSIEESVCCFCIESERLTRRCENCGVSEWHSTLRLQNQCAVQGLEHKWTAGHYDEVGV